MSIVEGKKTHVNDAVQVTKKHPVKQKMTKPHKNKQVRESKSSALFTTFSWKWYLTVFIFTITPGLAAYFYAYFITTNTALVSTSSQAEQSNESPHKETTPAKSDLKETNSFNDQERLYTATPPPQKKSGRQSSVTVDYHHQDLLQSYNFDFNQALQQRHKAMEKYSFPYSQNGVDKRSKLSLKEFQDVYDAKWPVIITDIVQTWPAWNWTLDYFINNYGDERVSMLGRAGSRSESLALPMKLFLKYINNSNEDVWSYLQDEVFFLQHPELRAHVLDTKYSKQNYFQLFPQEIRPWDCMLLWGTAHSRSHLHIDPYNWTGTNAVLKGLKKWKLFPPGQDDRLSIVQNAACGFPLDCNKYNSAIDAFGSKRADIEGLKFLEVDQLPGEMLFIPTGWFHQAYNAVPTLAVSGQFMNDNNYKIVLEEVFKGESMNRAMLPKNLNTLSPQKLVKHVMSNVPDRVLTQGAELTEDAIFRLHDLDD